MTRGVYNGFTGLVMVTGPGQRSHRMQFPMTLNIPVTRLARTPHATEIAVTVPTPEAGLVHMAHGIGQRMNDKTAGIKRSDYTDDESWVLAVLADAQAMADKLSTGNFGRGPRVVNPRQAAIDAVATETNATADELRAFIESRRATAEAA